MNKVQIEKANFLEDFMIELELSNKQRVYYDLKPQLNTARFKHIKSQAFFETGRLVNRRYIYWDPLTEIQDYEMLGELLIKEDFQE